MNSLEQVRKHFDKDAPRFDAIYERRKSWHWSLVDAFRRVVVQRFELVRALAPLSGRWSVLDVGCGTCRYGVALAKRGASRIVGIDVSGGMIAMAHAEVRRLGLEATFEFIEGDFLGRTWGERFDIVLGMGYFDYLREPLPHLVAMKSVCSTRIFASFPKRWEWRVPIRRLRFLLSGGYVRFYSRKEVETLIRSAGFEKEEFHLIDMGRDWIFVAACCTAAPGTRGSAPALTA
jgi:SAM-dependent methyltransferase